MTTENLARLGRRDLWQRIRTHDKTCDCPSCLEWARRWDLAEAATPKEVAE